LNAALSRDHARRRDLLGWQTLAECFEPQELLTATPFCLSPCPGISGGHHTVVPGSFRNSIGCVRIVIETPWSRGAEQAAHYTGRDIIEAEAARAAIGERLSLFHADHDLLITPQLPLAAFQSGVDVPPGSGMACWLDWSPFTFPFNLTRQPAASVPCGFTAAGLPVALQIVGPTYAEADVLRASRAFESARPFRFPEGRHL
jgi:Amidase